MLDVIGVQPFARRVKTLRTRWHIRARSTAVSRVTVGRLFWKFFFFFWLAQLTAGLGIGMLFWLKGHAPERIAPGVDASPPSVFEVDAAAATLRHGGVDALRELLAERAGEPGPPLFAVDEAQRELLDRPLPAALLDGAHRLLAGGRAAARPEERHHAVASVAAPDGRRYLLIVPAGAHAPPPGPPPHERGPLPPAAPLFAGALVSLLFAALLAWYFATPIRHLRAAFADAANGRLEQHLALEMGGRRDELADLGHDFDRMALQLKRLMNGQRRLLHDVSHELRSPLARLQAAIGLARQQPERLDELLARVEQESVRMDRLVSELLTLSRIEAGMGGRLDESVDLRELLATVAEDARFEAQAGGRRVECADAGDENPPPVCVRGNAVLLQRALENVVRNAVQHSPRDGKVTIALRTDAARQSARVEVDDEGCGVAETDLRAIFAPFFRSREGSSRDGHGLGLAIAQGVVELHRGRIEAANRAQGGLRVVVTLPVQANAAPAGAAS